MKTAEQQLVDQASLRAPSLAKLGQRIVLKVAAFGPSPLTREGADSFSRLLHGQKKGHAEHVLTYTNGLYYLDFNNMPVMEEDTLCRAVQETDAALLKKELPAEIVDAWAVPKDSPEVSQLLTAKQFDSLDRVTASALAISDSYRSEYMGNVALELLFTA